FKKFGVVLHFVRPPENGGSEPRENQETGNDESNNENDPFESFTQDLLSYRYGSGRAHLADTSASHSFTSEIVSLKWPGPVVLSVPAKIPFHSEGVDRTLYLPKSGEDANCRRRRLAVKGSRTTFASGHSIYH